MAAGCGRSTCHRCVLLGAVTPYICNAANTYLLINRYCANCVRSVAASCVYVCSGVRVVGSLYGGRARCVVSSITPYLILRSGQEGLAGGLSHALRRMTRPEAFCPTNMNLPSYGFTIRGGPTVGRGWKLGTWKSSVDEEIEGFFWNSSTPYEVLCVPSVQNIKTLEREAC